MELPNTNESVFSESVLRQIAEVYGLDSLSVIGKPDHGIITDNIIVEGNDGRKYFVKYYAQEESDKYAQTYRVAEVIANNQDIPAQIPLPNTQGTYTVNIGGKSLVMFPYVEHSHEPPANDVEDLRLRTNMAFLLGRMHAVPVPVDDPLLQPLPRWSVERCGDRVRELGRLQELISSMIEQSDFDKIALECIKLKQKYLNRLPPITEAASDMTALCHGDYHAKNVLYDKEQNILAIIDWDNAGLAHPYCEFLQSFMTNVIGDKYDTYHSESVMKAETFSDAYQKGFGKSIDVRALREVYSLFLHERIGSTFPLRQHYLENNTKNDNRLKYIVPRVKFLGERYEEVFDFIVKSL